MKYAQIAVIFMLMASCNSTPISSDKQKKAVEVSPSVKNVDSLEIVFNSKGVVSFKNNDKNQRNEFKLYNNDGSTFATVSLKQDKMIMVDQSYQLSDYEKSKNHFSKMYGFSPRAFYPQTGFIFQFEYKTIQENRIEVFIDRDHSVTKYIDNDFNLFKVETWQKHMLGAVIDFNKNKNPLRENLLTTSKSINLTGHDDLVFSVSQIQNDWVKIECVDFCGFSCPGRVKIQGWLKWRSGSEILIRFIYAC